MDKFDGFAYVIGVWKNGEFVGYIAHNYPFGCTTKDILRARFYKTRETAQSTLKNHERFKITFENKIFKVRIDRVSYFDDNGKEMPFI